MKQSKNEYKVQEIEKKWSDFWVENKTFSPDIKNAKSAYYTLMMFPYPSAEGLHVGNMYAFTGADVYARFMRMQGKDVFEPIGLDGFGIHSENYALKVGKHPAKQAEISARNFYRQLKATGNSYDWTKTLETYDPKYYRWTQWLFIQMFKAGLAYRKKAVVNWCPSDKTVLADEQVIDGKCERDGAVVEKKELEQWFFKITDYADKLLQGLENINWSEKVKIAQSAWIGKSEGAVINFSIDGLDRQINVFTTRPDTLMGVTFMVLSPEHPVVKELIGEESDDKQNNNDIENGGFDIDKLGIDKKTIKELASYVEKSAKKPESQRLEEKEKTGVFSGLYCVNPVSGEKIPVWVADYVLMGYGTGAIMAVPAHDTRDFEFAKKYDLPIKQVIVSDEEFGKPLHELKEAYTGDGGIVNSGEWDDFRVPAALPKIIDWLEQRGLAKRQSNYHLRDWLISRQRYWGPPIPMIFCKNCFDKGHGELDSMPGWHTVPEQQLPVLLPEVEDWKPKGEGTSPLANHPEFYNVKCPSCGSQARRETDVSDTFLDSAWYYLRYPSVGDSKNPYDTETIKKWFPVDIYIGGAEHSVLHLLYVRFIAMVLHNLKNQLQELALPFEEPFPRFFAHGLIVKDGAKMSKSKGNVIVPDIYIEKFGADTLRMYLMFLGQFKDGGDFRDTGIEGMGRFIKRLWNFFHDVEIGEDTMDVKKGINKTVKNVTEDIEKLSYNTAIAKLMEFYNLVKDQKTISKPTILSYLKLIAPFAPYLTEEIHEKLNFGEGSIHKSLWPTYSNEFLVEENVIVVVQINGKRRAEFSIEKEKINDQKMIEELSKQHVKSYIDGKEIRKVIYVPGKIINFVV